MSEIEFKLVDGEPVCQVACKKTETYGPFTSPCRMRSRMGFCIPGLRQQRDDARAVLGRVEHLERYSTREGRAMDRGSMIRDTSGDWVRLSDVRALLPVPAAAPIGRDPNYRYCKSCAGRMALDEDTWRCVQCRKSATEGGEG